MKNRELFGIMAGLQSVGGLRGVRFVYAAAKNSRLVSEEITALQEANKPDEGFMAFDTARVALCVEHAEKDEAGKPKVNGAGYSIAADRQALFNASLATLREAHAEALECRKEQLKEFEALLDEDTAVKLHQVAVEHLPEDITGAQLTAILDMIADVGN